VILVKNWIIILVLSCFSTAFAQSRKQLSATRVEGNIKVDGFLNETTWSTKKGATGFVEQSPNNGAKVADEYQTEVKVSYTDNSVYFALFMKDSKPDSILKELGFRDEFGKNTDWIEIRIFPYDDAQNKFAFNLSAGNIQIDQKNGDASWNAIWDSKVKITDKGWVAEIEIPFSSLRFPDSDVQSWGLNIVRHKRRTRETSSWQFMDASLGNEDQQTGILKGIQGLKTPVRLSLFPYLTISHDENSSSNPNAVGGMDLKYGLSNSYTMDMTLVPDFGQSDFVNEVHNISPFEVRLNENRDFFTEGTELFNKGDLFYSRRIANGNANAIDDQLRMDEEVESEIKQPKLFNAFKLSGRSDNGLGTGFFNAISLENTAMVLDTLSGAKREVILNPLTNYSVFVVDKAFRDGSSIAMVNTYVGREGSSRDAYTYALLGKLFLNKDKYQISGAWKQSHIFDEQGDKTGFNTGFQFEKIAGKLNYSFWEEITSDKFDINDLGYIDVNNKYNVNAAVKLKELTANKKRVNGEVEAKMHLKYIYAPNLFVSWDVNLSANETTHKFLSHGVNASLRFIEKNNYYESRTGGFDHKFITGASQYIQYWVSPDYRKKIAVDANVSVYNRSDHGHQSVGYKLAPRIRVSNNLSFILEARHNFDRNHVGWTTFLDSDGETSKSFSDDMAEIIFAKRELKTFVHELTAQYHLNSKLSFSVRMRHYWRDLRNTSFHQLKKGYLEDTAYDGLDEEGRQKHDLVFNSLNADLGCVWRFAPGSEMSLLLRTSYLDSFDHSENNYLESTREVLKSDLNNLVSLKVLYFLDYKKIKNTFI